MRILRFRDLKAKGVAGSRATLFRLQNGDPTFPRAIEVGGGVGWIEEEIDGWIEARPRVVKRAQRSMIADNVRKATDEVAEAPAAVGARPSAQATVA